MSGECALCGNTFYQDDFDQHLAECSYWAILELKKRFESNVHPHPKEIDV